MMRSSPAFFEKKAVDTHTLCTPDLSPLALLERMNPGHLISKNIVFAYNELVELFSPKI
jgi:hypothetical protein